MGHRRIVRASGRPLERVARLSSIADGDRAQDRPPGSPARVPGAGALWLLAAVTSIAALYFARPIVLPVVLALLLSVVLGPAVRRMQRFVSAPFGAAVLLLTFGVLLVALGWQLARPAQEWIDGLPTQLREIGLKSSELVARVESYRSLAEEVEDLATAEKADDAVVTVEVATGPSLSSRILARARYAVGLLMASAVLLYFLLAGRNAFLVNLIRLAPGLRSKERATGLLHRVEEEVARYFLTVALINCCLGLAVGVAVALLGVGNPALWGALATLFNFIPYLGAAVGVSLLALSSVLSGESLWAMVLPPLAYLLLTAVEGTFVTPAVLGRRFAISAVIILISLFFWGWLWGVAGAFLAVPLLVVLRVIAEQVPELGPVRNLLDRSRARGLKAFAKGT